MSDDINKLLEISQMIVISLEMKDLYIFTDEEKISLEETLDSMKFFSEEGHVSRAITEGELALKKIERAKQ